MSQPTDIVQSSSCVGLNSLQLLLADFGLIFYGRVVGLAVYIFNTPRQTEPNRLPIIITNLLHLEIVF